jgi:glyoxylate reductase
MKKSKKVLITVNLPKIAYDYLKKHFEVVWNKPQLTHDQLIKKVAPFQAVLTTIADKADDDFFEAAPHLKVIANMAVGFNNIDLQAAHRRGVVVTNTPDVLTDATADLTWALLLASARRLPEGERMIQSGHFKGVHPLMLLGTDLKGKTCHGSRALTPWRVNNFDPPCGQEL